MCVSFQTKKSKEIPGVVHVDNSCRVQTVNNSIPHIYSLLNEFNNKTGCPILLNTSFNLAGQPLIETQEEAIECFSTTNIDVLWFPETGRCLVK
jgi:carbamoyltransferase